MRFQLTPAIGRSRFLLCVLAVLLSACDNQGGGATSVALTTTPTPRNLLRQSTFDDCQAYRDYHAEALAQDFLAASWFRPCWGCEVLVDVGAPVPVAGMAPGGELDGSESAAAPDSGGSGVAAASDTNTQESGVDEADLIEVDPDAGVFYIARQASSEILTVSAVPAESMTITDRIAIGPGFLHGIYLDHERDRLVAVVGDGGFWFAEGAPVQDYRPRVSLLFFDVSDPEHPVQDGRYEIAGVLTDSRRIDGRVHLVTGFTPWLPSSLAQDASFFTLVYDDYARAVQEDDAAAQQELAAQIRSRVRTAVNAAPLAELLPEWRTGTDSAFQPADCASVWHPEVEQRIGLVTVSSIDTDGTSLSQASFQNNGWLVYASAAHLYLVQYSGGWWFDEAQTQQTAIYRLDISPGGPATPDGFGVVDGFPLNSYSLGEHEGHLRIATTESRFAPDAPRWQRSNHLFVLGEDSSGDLEVVGQVRDFVRDESVFAARFIGDRGFVVTFEVIDPLFTFDLSDPARPRLAGELELPGFSTYLHPFGEDHLVAIGRDASLDGRLTGRLALQLFDVGDLANPQLSDRVTIGSGDAWAWSPAEHDPHAFTLFGDLLSIPVQVWDASYDGAFSGFAPYRLSAQTGFSELPRIDHKQPAGGGGGGCPPVGPDDQPVACSSFAPVYYSPPLRSAVVEEAGGRTVLYTLSDLFLKALDPDGQADLGSLTLTE